MNINKWCSNSDNYRKRVRCTIDILLILSSLMSFVPQISIISIGIFSLNFIFIKRKIKASLIFFNIAVITSVLYYSYLKPRTEAFEKEIYTIGFHQNWEEAARSKLNHYNNEIIKYKDKNGTLPSKLENIQNGYMDFEDISFVINCEKHMKMEFAKFYYEMIDSNHYQLYGLGPDGRAKTKDDLVPEIKISDTSKTDLIRYTIKDSSKLLVTQMPSD